MGDSENTIDWVVKLESQLYPVLNAETTDADAQIQQVDYKLNHIIPEIKHAQQEIQLRIQTAKELIVEGALDNHEEVPPKLHELHDSICTIIDEYTTFLEMFASFLKNIKELEKKIISLKELTEDMDSLDVIEQINQLQVKQSAASTEFHNLWKISCTESQNLIAKVKQQESNKYAESDIQTINSLVQNKQLEWDNLSATLDRDFEILQIQKQFDYDLVEINTSISELSDELTSLQYQYTLSLSAAKSSSLAFQCFEKTIQSLETKIESFLNTKEEVLKANESKFEEIEDQIDQLKDDWNKFCAQVAETQHLIDLTIQYFTLIDETEECFREGTKLLVCVARKSSAVHNSEEAGELLNDIEEFLNALEVKTEERIKNISTLVVQLFSNDDEHSRQVSRIIAENSDMLHSFQAVSKELTTMQTKLKSSHATDSVEETNEKTTPKEVEKLPAVTDNKEDEEVVQVSDNETCAPEPEPEIEIAVKTNISHNETCEKELVLQPQTPVFVSTLTDASVPENSKFIFQCEVKGNPTPEIMWFKDEMPVVKNPNYQTTFCDGICKLCIEEVFVEDSAKYICRAINEEGKAETFAVLSVVEKYKDHELCPPKFLIKLSDSNVEENEICELSCKVSGTPLPVVQWFKGDVCIDEQPFYKITYNNGDAKLLIKDVILKDASTYTCTAINPSGRISSSCIVKVLGKCTSADTSVASNPAEETSCLCNGSAEEDTLPCETSDSETASDTDCESIRPSITAALADVTVKEGTEAVLECVIIGQPEPEVIWYQNDIPVKENDKIELYFEGDNCSLHIKDTSHDEAGVYKVVAINLAGEISTTCQLQVLAKQSAENYDEEELSPPKFNKLLTDVLVREGDTAVLECSVVGVPKPDVKWFLNSSEINFNERVKSEKNKDGNILLVIQNITSDDKGLYTARASNSLGEAKCFSHVIVKSLQTADLKSCDIHLEDKFESPAFAELFTNKVVTEGEPAKFECIVNGKPAPKVKWLFNSEPVSGKSFLVSTSGDRQVLCIPQVDQENTGVISCVAENDVGKASCEAHLHVTNSVSRDELIPTLNTTMNVSESSNSYEVKKASFTKSVAFNNESPVSKTDSYLRVSEEATKKVNDGEPIKTASHHVEEKHEIDGKLADHSSQSFTSDDLDELRKIQYSKQNGVASLKPARKQTAPRFLSPLNGAIVDPGRDTKFEAVVESYPAANIVWHKNNVELSSEPNKMRITWELNRATLEIFNVDANDAGRYMCSASNDAGTASSAADLFVKKVAFPPVMGKRLHPQSVAVGKRAIFEIEVTGTPTPFVRWFKDDVLLARTSPFYRTREQGNSHALIFENARPEDSGQYKVKAHNEAGEAVSLTTLHVFEPPTSISENREFSLSNIESMSTGAVPTFNHISDSDFSKMNLSHNTDYMKTVEIMKTDKHTSILDGKKIQNDFNVPKEKYEFHDPKGYTESSLKDLSTKTIEATNLYSMNLVNNPTKPIEYSATDSNEIKMLQKPLHYSDMDAFQAYSSYDKSNVMHYNNEIYLEPGPPPEMGYIPKDTVPKAKEAMADRLKKLENSQRQLSPVEIPTGAVRIFPTIIPKKKEPENIHQKKYTSCINEYKNTVQRSTSCEEKREFQTESFLAPCVQETPNIKLSNIEKERKETETLSGPIYRPPADVDLRPLSPRPSAEGVNMERLWSQRKNVEEQTYLRPVTPHNFNNAEESSAFSRTNIRRSLSPLPSADGVAMDKMWSHAKDKSNRPHSVIGFPETEESSKCEKFESVTWAPVSGPAKTETHHTYKDLHKINDRVVSRNAVNENVSNYNGRNYQRSFSEERGKKIAKKFQWPPQEVSFEDSSVRRTDSQKMESTSFSGNIKPIYKPGQPSEMVCNMAPSNTVRNLQVQNSGDSYGKTEEKYVYDGVRTVPLPTMRSLHEKQESVSNQTLPRSFKFTSCNNSKFKPVKPFTSSRSEIETTKMSTKGSTSWKPLSPMQSNVNSSSVIKESFSSNSNNDFGHSNNSVFSKPAMKTETNSGYIADMTDSLKRSSYLAENTSTSISSSYQKYHEGNKTQTLPRISDNKISTSFIDDTKIHLTSRRPDSYTFTTDPSPLKFSKSDFRETTYENNYQNRIPPIWRPSDSDPDAPCFRPVRPNLTPVQRPFYNRSASAEVENEFKYRDVSKSSFHPVSPATDYSNQIRFKPSPAFSASKHGTEVVNERRYNRSFSNEGDTTRSTNEVFQNQVWQKPNGYEGNYEALHSTSEVTNQGSKFTELTKLQKVEEIRKRFESNSFSNEPSCFTTSEDSAGVNSSFRSRIHGDSPAKSASMHSSETVRSSYKTNSQQFIDNVVNNVNHKQNELKLRAMKSPSLYNSASVVHEPQIIKDHYKNSEHGIEQVDAGKQVAFFEYNFDYDYEYDTSEVAKLSESFATFPRMKMKPANVMSDTSECDISRNEYTSIFKPIKITDVSYSKWSPKRRRVSFENKINVKSITPDSEYTNFVSSASGYDLPVSSNESGWASDLTRSTEADYAIVNGGGFAGNEGTQTVPVFSTPLHDIAAVTGSKAKFECIVQSDLPFNVEWRKDGIVLQKSDLCQISLRNGVCTLTLLRTYIYDAGTYHCIAVNRAGFAETSANLVVSAERRSFIKK